MRGQSKIDRCKKIQRSVVTQHWLGSSKRDPVVIFVSIASGVNWRRVGPEILGASCALSDSINNFPPLSTTCYVPRSWHSQPPNLERKFLVAILHSSYQIGSVPPGALEDGSI